METLIAAEWRALLADMAAHTSPDLIVRRLTDTVERWPVLTLTCDRCGVVAGRCRTQSGGVARTHAERLRRAQHAVHRALWASVTP